MKRAKQHAAAQAAQSGGAFATIAQGRGTREDDGRQASASTPSNCKS